MRLASKLHQKTYVRSAAIMGHYSRTKKPKSGRNEHESSEHRHRKDRSQGDGAVEQEVLRTPTTWSAPQAIDEHRRGYWRYRPVTEAEALRIQQTAPNTVQFVAGRGWIQYALQDRETVIYQPRIVYEPQQIMYDTQPGVQHYQQAAYAHADDQYASSGLAYPTYGSDSLANMVTADDRVRLSKRTPSISTGSSEGSQRPGYGGLEQIRVKYDKQGRVVSKKYAVKEYR